MDMDTLSEIGCQRWARTIWAANSGENPNKHNTASSSGCSCCKGYYSTCIHNHTPRPKCPTHYCSHLERQDLQGSVAVVQGLESLALAQPRRPSEAKGLCVG